MTTPSSPYRKPNSDGSSPYRLDEGMVRVGVGAYLVHASEGCEVWEIDMGSKYAGCTSIESDTEVEVMFYATADTLRCDESKDGPTVFTFPKVGDSHMLDGGRYSFRLAMFSHNQMLDSEHSPVVEKDTYRAGEQA